MEVPTKQGRAGTSFEARKRALFGGVLTAHGYFFAESLFSAEQARTRAFYEARPGDRLFVSPLGLVLRFATPRSVDTAAAPGTALVEVEGLLCSAPLAAEVGRSQPQAVLAVMHAGHPNLFANGELEELPLWKLIDLSSFEVEGVQSLGEPAPPPNRVARVKDPTEELGRVLGIGQAQKRAQTAVIRDLTQPEAAPVRGRFVARALLRAAAWLGSGLRRGMGGRSSAEQSAQTPVQHGRVRSFFDSILRAIERRLFLSVYASKQAAYLSRLFSLLESRSDEEALREAIPLANESSEGASRLALAPPKPRSSFEIGLAAKRASSAYALGDDLFSRLRIYYERLFERLDRAGRHQEAAFVLVELLNDVDRALTYMEQHGRFDFAAELAEARGLAPGRCVRLWFLARNIERAMALAVQRDCFADAIERLMRSKHEAEARELRILYADRLAAAGKFVSAAELVANEHSMRALVLRWLALARSGGELGGVALELELDASRFEAVWQSAAPLLEDETLQASEEQLGLGRALLQRPTQASLPLTRALARRLIAAAGEHGSAPLADAARDLAKAAGGAFAADLPQIATFTRRLSAGTVTRNYRASSAGTHEMFDACRHGRRWLLALGEGGVALVNDAGKIVRHFDVPANALVLAPNSEHVLALMRRGKVHQVSRIHLGTSRSERWGDLEFANFAQSFDGERWFIERRLEQTSELCLLDVLADSPTVIERIPFDGVIGDLKISSTSVELVVSTVTTDDIASVSLPDFTLRRRAQLPPSESPTAAFAISEAGRVLVLEESSTGASSYSYTLVQGAGRTVIGNLLSATRQLKTTLHVSGDFFALCARLDSGERLLAGSISRQQCTLQLDFDGLSVSNYRLAGSTLWVCLREGRALCFDLESGDELGSLRF